MGREPLVLIAVSAGALSVLIAVSAGALSVTTRSGVFVVGERDEFRADESLLGHELHLRSVANQLRRQQHRDVFDVLPPVAGGVLSFEIGVDRHLGDSASTNGIDEVDGRGAALRPDDVQC